MSALPTCCPASTQMDTIIIIHTLEICRPSPSPSSPIYCSLAPAPQSPGAISAGVIGGRLVFASSTQRGSWKQRLSPTISIYLGL